MTTQRTRPSRPDLALVALFLGIFVIGSAELLMVGVLDLVADDLDVSIPAAGGLVTAYAFGVAVGGPVLTAVTIRHDRRVVLTIALLLFTAGILLPLLTDSLVLFVAARAVTGALHGLLVACSFAAGMAAVPPERAGRAISAVLSGVAVSATLGVPLGTLLGQAVGWRGSFVALAGAGLVALAAVLVLVPAAPSPGGGATDQARHAFAPRVLAVLALCSVAFASLFAALTYIVPFLEDVTGVSGAVVSAFLLAYGVATAVGTVAGGRLADRDAARTLLVGTVGVAASLLALHVLGGVAFLAALALLAWGIFAWCLAPSLQHRVVSLAGPGGGLAQSLPASAINVGIALGSVVGGVAVDRSGPDAAVVTGLGIAVVAIPLAWLTSFLRPPATEVGDDPVAEDQLPSHGR